MDALAGILTSPAAIAAMQAGAQHVMAPCGEAWAWLDRSDQSPTGVYCDGYSHFAGGASPRPIGRCPGSVRAEFAARIGRERVRLAGVIEQIERDGYGIGWDGFDASTKSARDALEAMREFSRGRPPSRGVFLRGDKGRGKTRLMLAAYFDLLAGCVDAVYVTPAMLKQAWQDLKSFDEQTHTMGWALLERVRRARVAFLDDLGTKGDTSRDLSPQKNLKALIDDSRAVWCLSSNLNSAELAANPDCGVQNLDRLTRGAIVVVSEGDSWRGKGIEVRR